MVLQCKSGEEFGEKNGKTNKIEERKIREETFKIVSSFHDLDSPRVESGISADSSSPDSFSSIRNDALTHVQYPKPTNSPSALSDDGFSNSFDRFSPIPYSRGIINEKPEYNLITVSVQEMTCNFRGKIDRVAEGSKALHQRVKFAPEDALITLYDYPPDCPSSLNSSIIISERYSDFEETELATCVPPCLKDPVKPLPKPPLLPFYQRTSKITLADLLNELESKSTKSPSSNILRKPKQLWKPQQQITQHQNNSPTSFLVKTQNVIKEFNEFEIIESLKDDAPLAVNEADANRLSVIYSEEKITKPPLYFRDRIRNDFEALETDNDDHSSVDLDPPSITKLDDRILSPLPLSTDPYRLQIQHIMLPFVDLS
ncbi:hypothetical protein Ciccas_000946 [Cichlidogyrus casuarinus]|uniref:Uncharacterized protein n=1 Tax=Cichlidogyrus casuarinus TaxID=1844966 RepID=A0ABD2QLH9_9PLAT